MVIGHPQTLLGHLRQKECLFFGSFGENAHTKMQIWVIGHPQMILGGISNTQIWLNFLAFLAHKKGNFGHGRPTNVFGGKSLPATLQNLKKTKQKQSTNVTPWISIVSIQKVCNTISLVEFIYLILPRYNAK